jgi:hypothetical protein
VANKFLVFIIAFLFISSISTFLASITVLSALDANISATAADHYCSEIRFQRSNGEKS